MNSSIPLPINSQNNNPYFPIEFFKNRPRSPLPYLFRSSGTTQAIKATSYYSKRGLELYRASAIKHFLQILNFYNLDSKTKGISLVPSTKEWKNSSLATMIEWFVEEFSTIEYATNTNIIDSIEKYRAPLWIFGTADHLLNLCKHIEQCRLPKGSIVIETGGSKDKKIAYNKKALYSKLTHLFQIDESHIVSEYGMCELACQAYDHFNFTTSKRTGFYFPDSVNLSVTRGNHIFEPHGMGSLTVDDPNRIDYPHPIRTQDIVDLSSDGSFQLLGRSHSAPTKGCSLNVSDLTVSSENPSSAPIKNTSQLDISSIQSSFNLKKFFIEWFRSNEFIESLTEEIGSLASATRSAQEFEAQALECNLDECIKTMRLDSQERLLFILPNNHSTVLYYPLLLALSNGNEVTIRIPRAFINNNGLITFLQSLLQKTDKLKVISPNQVLNTESIVQSFDKALCYGTNATLAHLKAEWSIPIQGFGEVQNYIVINSFDDISNILHDAFQLAQRGCMAAQAILFVSHTPLDKSKLSNQLRIGFQEYWNNHLSIFQQCSLDYMNIKYPDALPRNTTQPLFPIIEAHNLKLTMLHNPEFCLPIIKCDSNAAIKNTLELATQPLRISTNFKIEEFEAQSTPLGTLGKHTWDSTWQNTQLFSCTN